MNIEEKVKRWVVLDNNTKKYSEEIKKIRIEKNNLCNDLVNYFEEKNVKFPNINISDGKLNLAQTNVANPITFKFLQNCFNEFFDDENDVNNLLDLIKSKRIYNKSIYIRRVYNKNNNI